MPGAWRHGGIFILRKCGTSRSVGTGRPEHMEIHCPRCGGTFSRHDENQGGPSHTAVCPACGGAVPATSFSVMSTDAAPLPGESSFRFVSDSAPRYSRLRDPLIIACVLCALAGLLAGGWYVTGKVQRSFSSFTAHPVGFVARLFKLTEPYDACTAFLRDNRDRFPHLEGTLTFTLLEQHIRIVDGKKTARLSMKVKGDTEVRHASFSLEKREGRWQVVSVELKSSTGDRTRHPYPRSRNGLLTGGTSV